MRNVLKKIDEIHCPSCKHITEETRRWATGGKRRFHCGMCKLDIVIEDKLYKKEYRVKK